MAGEDVDSYCAKCGFTLAHIIIAVDVRKIARVECKTCRAQHGFRRAPGSPAPAKAKAKTTARKSPRAAGGSRRVAAGSPPSLETVLAGRPTDDVVTWQMGACFDEGQIMRHPKFELGVVQRVMADDKVEVLFADPISGPEAPGVVKILAHARR